MAQAEVRQSDANGAGEGLSNVTRRSLTLIGQVESSKRQQHIVGKLTGHRHNREKIFPRQYSQALTKLRHASVHLGVEKILSTTWTGCTLLDNERARSDGIGKPYHAVRRRLKQLGLLRDVGLTTMND
jgi:hypothetical protein